jgi:osmotically-inducible protein OsmY
MAETGCNPIGSALFLPSRLLALAVLALVLPSARTEPPPALFRPPTTASPVEDIALAVRARKALQEDPELGHLILGIQAENGILRLWGPIPSMELGQRVVKKLEGLKGVRSIRNELRVSPPGMERATIPLIADPPTQTESASPGSAPVPDRAFPEIESPERSGSPKNPASPAVALLPPVSVPEKPSLSERPSTLVTSTPRENVGGLTATLDQMRRRDERFRTIQPEVQGGIVRLRGTAARGEDAMAFAQLVSQLPGVERVILEVRVPPVR